MCMSGHTLPSSWLLARFFLSHSFIYYFHHFRIMTFSILEHQFRVHHASSSRVMRLRRRLCGHADTTDCRWAPRLLCVPNFGRDLLWWFWKCGGAWSTECACRSITIPRHGWTPVCQWCIYIEDRTHLKIIDWDCCLKLYLKYYYYFYVLLNQVLKYGFCMCCLDLLPCFLVLRQLHLFSCYPFGLF